MASSAKKSQERDLTSIGFDKKSSRDSPFDRHQAFKEYPPHDSPTTKSAPASPSTPLTTANLRLLDTLRKRSPKKDRSSGEEYMKKRGSPKKQDKKRVKRETDSHPLNLPPDELRRLSARMAKEEAARLSTDTEDNADDQNGVQADNMEWTATTPFDEPSQPIEDLPNGVTNGVNGHAESERSPTPPPHKPPPKPPIDAEACKAAGNKFFKAKDYYKAIDEYSKAVEAEPKNPTYLSNRAAAYISANKYDAALSDSLQANQLDPTNDKILHRLARIYTSLGRPQDALDTYSNIPGGVSAKDTAAAKHAAMYLKTAETQIADPAGNANMALWNLDQAKQSIGPGVPWPRRWQLLRARAHIRNGSINSLGEVQGITTSLMRDDPNDAEAIVLAGRGLYLKDDKPPTGKSDYQRAEDCFRAALSRDPDMSEARESLKTLKKLERARNEANDVFKRGRHSEAINKYTEALLIDPSNKITNAKLLGNRAQARIKIKSYDDAISDCDAALKLDPTYLKARKTRAKATGESGDWAKAVEDLKSLAEENPNDPVIAKEIQHAELELKKSKRKDYYKILGVEKDAGDAEISRAYKKQALKCHPDKFPEGEERDAKEEEFKELQEANETLSDPQKRQRYDSGVDLMEPGGGMGGFPGGFGGMGGGGGVQIDPEMLFNMMNGGGGGRPGGGFSFNTGGGGGRGFPF